MGGDVVACDVVVVNAVVVVVVVDDMTCDVAFVVAEAPCGFEVVVVVEHTDVNAAKDAVPNNEPVMLFATSPPLTTKLFAMFVLLFCADYTYYNKVYSDVNVKSVSSRFSYPTVIFWSPFVNATVNINPSVFPISFVAESIYCI